VFQAPQVAVGGVSLSYKLCSPLQTSDDHHPMNLPVSAAQKEPVFSRFRSSTTAMIRFALSSGVRVFAVSLSSATPLALRRPRSICVLTCSTDVSRYQNFCTPAPAAMDALHICASGCVCLARHRFALPALRTTPGWIRATGMLRGFRSRAKVAPAMFRAAFPIRYPYCRVRTDGQESMTC